MLHTTSTKTLLALAVAAAIAACSSTDESVPPPAASATQTAANASAGAAQDANAPLQEIQVTGSRIITGDSRRRQNAAAERASAATTFIRTVEPPPRYQPAPGSGENYANLADNGIHRASLEPVSTFSIDVDTGSYSNVRRFLQNGQLPPVDAVRTEELVNYFDYDYPRDPEGAEPFSLVTEIAASPWNPGRHLLHIGVQAVDVNARERPASNLVFLVDVSGSMDSPDKLDLLKTSLKLLARQLDEDDSIAIVVYAGASGVVLEPTDGDETATIMGALERLHAGGSTNGAAGIELAYRLAEREYIEGGINRVLLATDGDFNVGLTDFDALRNLIERKRRSGIGLTTLGFGTGNYNDRLMEQLADAGNGNYAYIDSVNEARKVLVDELGSTLQTVAKDVKVQVEFNPAVVGEYRLIGYENRMLATADFNNDRVDAGEIGAGHAVTALYEISLVGSPGKTMDPLRYGPASPQPLRRDRVEELAFLKLRYKEPEGNASRLLERPLRLADIVSLDETTANYRFAAAVAGFSQLLRGNGMLGEFDYDDVLELAVAGRAADEHGYRSEFINLVKTAQALQ